MKGKSGSNFTMIKNERKKETNKQTKNERKKEKQRNAKEGQQDPTIMEERKKGKQ